MILPVHIIGSSVLRKKAVDIDENFEGLNELIENMYETMNSAEGIGLAAPQVGVSVRIFIIDASPMGEDEPELMGFKRTFINAQIVERSGEMIFSNEGCLSIPDIREDILRYPKLTIEYVNEKFEKVSETLEGMKAVIVQHEYDHLDGILFTDKVAPLRKKLLKRKLESIAKGKFPQRYKFKLGEKYR